MSKKKTLSKLALTWSDIDQADLDLNKIKDLKEVKSAEFYQDQNKVASALLDCLLDNDTDTYIEILDEYLNVNRSQVAREAHIGRSTIQEVFSKKGNPTLKTIAKIVHYAAGNSKKAG